jgi:aspartate/glutamate/glutamine transport system permease protein
MISELFKLENILFLGQGLLLTLMISGGAIFFSLIFGTILGVARSSKHPLFGRISSVYIEVVRNIPNLLFIIVARILLPVSPLALGIIAFTVFTSAAFGEIIRAGLSSTSKGQWEAARSQGFGYFTTLRYIILPQAYRNIIPPLVSQCITVVKDTSFLWAVSVEELTGKGMIIMGRYGSESQIFMLFFMIAATYFAMNYLLAMLARKQQYKLRYQG